MELIIEKKENDFFTQIKQVTGEAVNFDYITFINGLYKTGGNCSIKYIGEFTDEEKQFLNDIFRKISEIFKSDAKQT